MLNTNTSPSTLNHELSQHIHEELSGGANRLKYEILLSEKMKAFLSNARLEKFKKVDEDFYNSTVDWSGQLTDGTNSYRLHGTTGTDGNFDLTLNGNFNLTLAKMSANGNLVIPPEYKEFPVVVDLLTTFPFISYLPTGTEEP